MFSQKSNFLDRVEFQWIFLIKQMSDTWSQVHLNAKPMLSSLALKEVPVHIRHF